jgi:hypothetical protein
VESILGWLGTWLSGWERSRLISRTTGRLNRGNHRWHRYRLRRWKRRWSSNWLLSWSTTRLRRWSHRGNIGRTTRRHSTWLCRRTGSWKLEQQQEQQQQLHRSDSVIPYGTDEEKILPGCRTPSSVHEMEVAEIEGDKKNDDSNNNNTTGFAGQDIEMNNMDCDQHPASFNGSESLIVYQNLEECDEMEVEP